MRRLLTDRQCARVLAIPLARFRKLATWGIFPRHLTDGECLYHPGECVAAIETIAAHLREQTKCTN